MADWAQWSPLSPHHRRMRPATIAVLSVGRRDEELWCDSLTNGFWQNPWSHKGRTVALHMYRKQWTHQSSVIVCVCVCVCKIFSFIKPVTWNRACLLYCVTIRQSSHLVAQLRNFCCWGPLSADCVECELQRALDFCKKYVLILASSKRKFHHDKFRDFSLQLRVQDVE